MVTSVLAASRTSTLLRFLQRVEVRVVAVALVGEHLHGRVLQVPFADAEHRQEHAALPFLARSVEQLVVAGHADVEVAVGGEDHAVDAVAIEVLARGGIGELMPAAPLVEPPAARPAMRAVNRPPCDRPVSAAGRARWRRRRRRSPRDPAAASVSVSIRIDACTSGSLSGRLHRPETSSRNTRLRGGRFRRRQRAALQPDQREVMRRIPGARRELGRNREWLRRRRLAHSRTGSS